MDPTHPGYGVVLAVYTTAGRPLTFETNKILVSGRPGRADVCFDPNLTYYVRCDASAGNVDTIGQNVMLGDSFDKTGLRSLRPSQNPGPGNAGQD